MCNDIEIYRQRCSVMQKWFADSDKADEVYFTAWTCCLAPDSGVDLESLTKMCDRVLGKAPDYAARYLLIKGVLAYRQGKFTDAIASLSQIRDLEAASAPLSASAFYGRVFLSMAYAQIHDQAKAQEWYDKSIAALSSEQTGTDQSLSRKAILFILQSEALKRLK